MADGHASMMVVAVICKIDSAICKTRKSAWVSRIPFSDARPPLFSMAHALQLIFLRYFARKAENAVQSVITRETIPRPIPAYRDNLIVLKVENVESLRGAVVLHVSFAARFRAFWRRLRSMFGRTREPNALTATDVPNYY